MPKLRLAEAAADAVADRPTPLSWPAENGVLALYFTAVAPASTLSPAWIGRHAIPIPAAIARSVPHRQAQFIAGRLCARAGIAGCGLPGTEVGTGALGAPVWPPGLMGSISHTSTLAVATVQVQDGWRGIGIDLESVPDAAGVAAVRAVSLNAAERKLVEATGSLSEELLSILIFSAKESFFKATASYVGRYFDFTAIECVQINARTLTCVVRERLGPLLQPGLALSFDLEVADRIVLTGFRW